jgi:enamine deaminase RidA (YjgF/YER057c/UK114 family)
MNRIMTVSDVGGRKVVSTGTRWEPVVGYSRAVRAGNLIAVTGTIGLQPDGSCPPDAAEQTRLALGIICAAIDALGGKQTDVFRTRIYLTDIGRWEEVGRVHSEFFGKVRPATTMVEISALADPAACVEIEADALVAG